MGRWVMEISISAEIGGELRQASAEVEVPKGTSWEAAADLAAAFGAAYARLWSMPADIVHTSVTLAQTERVVLRYGDVPSEGRSPRTR